MRRRADSASLATTSVIMRGRGKIHPANHTVIDQVDIDLVPKRCMLIVRGAKLDGGAQIKPVLIMARVPHRVIRLTPNETQRLSAHALARQATADGVTIRWIESLQALGEPDLSEIRRALARARWRPGGPR